MLLRIFWFLAVLISAATGPLWFLLLTGISYAFYYAGLELLVVALAVDSYFGYERTEWPIYTLATFFLVLMVRFLRPYISVYNR